MTEFFNPGVNSAAAPEAGGASAGALLRRARESSGLHIAALAVALKVPVKKIEALEADRLDLLPDAVFARALAASICRHLKLDPQQVLSLLPASDLRRLPASASGGLNTPFRSPGVGSRAPSWTQVSRPAVLAGVVFVVAGAALLFLLPKAEDTKNEEPVAGASVPAALPPVPEATTPVMVTEGVASQATANAAAVQGPASTAPMTQPGAPVVQSPSTPAPLPSAPAKPAAPADLVSFNATRATWIEVMDGRGTVVLRRQLAAGENASISGLTPLKVVVGRADSVAVQVRGQAMDLAPLSRDNVARFEVK